ncbi:major facilitator superfamily domain-containing protein 10-like protein, partial [Leptotrombidium deliense]
LYYKMQNTCLVVCTSLVIDLVAFTMILPLFPSIFEHYSTEDSSGLYAYLDGKVVEFQNLIKAPQQLNKVLFSGFIGAWFSFLQFLSSPFIGAFSDVFGRRISLLISLFGTLCSYIIWSFSSNSFALFLLSRTLGGLSKGNVSLSTAIVTDVSTEEKRGKAMAFIGVAFSIGFITGPMFGAFISHKFGSTFFYASIFATFLATLNLFYVFYSFNETLPKHQRVKSIGTCLWQAYNYIIPWRLLSFTAVKHIKQKGSRIRCNGCNQMLTTHLNILREAGWIYFLYLLLYSGLEYSLSFLTHLRFNYTSMQQGKMYLFCGILMTLIQGVYVRRIFPGRELKIASYGLMSIIPSFIIIGLSSNSIQLIIGLTLYSFSSATVVPCLTTVASTNGPVDQKGTILGIFRSLGSLARALGPILSSLLFWRFGSQLCYCGGGLLLIVPLIYLKHLKMKMK